MVESSSPALDIRTELFEHGLYPLQTKLTDQILIALFKNLHMISSIDYKITHKQWSDAVAKNVPSITKQQADVYFLTYRSLLGDIEGPPQQVKSPLDATVDVRCFAIYFAA